MNLTKRTLPTAVALLLGAGVLATTGANATSATPPASAAAGSWPYPNVDLANTRVATSSTISSANVSDLKEAWTFKLTGEAAAGVGAFKNYGGSLAANPVVLNGVVYLQDLDSNVYALALATGEQKWAYEVNLPVKSGPGPNGVAVANGVVYGATPTSVFALNAATGHKIWVHDDLLNGGQGTFGIQPQVADGRVYLASQYGKAPEAGCCSR